MPSAPGKFIVDVTAEPATVAPKFTLLVSEKGGAERRQAFHCAEITLGRVQGNDLVLPKGNVSKRHARILFREGRFIVADLNSTNGTYVNRRRIAQATIIREDDRVYVGDFIIRLISNDESQDMDIPIFHSTPNASHQLPGRTLKPESGDARGGSLSWEKLTGGDELARTSQVSGSSPSSSAPPSAPRGASEPPHDSSSSGQRFSDMASGHRKAVAQTIQSVLKEIERPPLKPDTEYRGKVRAKVDAVVDALLVAGEVPVGTSAEAVGEQALDELLDLGPLGELLDDPAVTSISAARFDELGGTRDGRQQIFPPGFSLASSFEQALERLCERSGTAMGSEGVVDRKLNDGTKISIIRGEVSQTGPLLHIRKPRQIVSSLDDLVRRGAISRAMATFLGQCVAGHLNILVVGPPDEGAHVVLSALCSAASRERIVTATDFDDVAADREGTVRLDLSRYRGEARRLLEIASSIPQTRLAVTLTSAEFTTATLEATGRGMSGLLATLPAVNLNRGLLRLPADIVAERKGMSVEAATGWVLSAFDVVIEVTRLRDGRIRALRICEFKQDGAASITVNDIFRFAVSRVAAGGAVEGSFIPSGHTPRVASQLQALGMRVDASLFVRGGR